jgi:hypothetical protein
VKPRASNPRNLAVMRALSTQESWQDCREDPDYAPALAWELFAAWGELHRFFAELPAEVGSVPALVQRDASILLAALGKAVEPKEWLDRARDVEQAWDYTTREDALRELEMIAIDLFDRLDRHSLALCMARRLNSGSEADSLMRRAEQLAHAELFFAQHIDAFVPAAPLAIRVIAALRPDLEQADPELWRTTQIHSRLAEAWKEAEGGGSPPHLSERDKQASLVKVRHARLSCPAKGAGSPPDFSEQVAESAATEPQYSMAAAIAAEALAPLREVFARKTFQVEGDEAVQVELDLRPAPAPARRELWVRVHAPPDNVGKYIQCELNIPELPAPLIADLGIIGKVTLTEAQLQALGKGHENIVLTLLTADGTRRSTRPRNAA